MLIALVLLMMGYLSLITALRIPAVQKRLVRVAAAWLSKELNTEVRINGLRFEPFDRLVIRGIYIADQDNDTLLYARVLKLNFKGMDRKRHHFEINTIELADAVIRMVKSQEDRSMNFDFITKYFSKTTSDTLAAVPWRITADRLSLINVRFHYRDLKYDDPSEGIDFEDIEVNRLYATLRHLYQHDDSLSFDLRTLSFTEKSGFTLTNLSSSFVKIVPDSLCLDNMHLKTDKTELKGRLAFGFKHLSDFDDFAGRIQLKLDFEESQVHSDDLAYFAPELKGMNRSVQFAGLVRGTVNQLRLRQFSLRYGNGTEFKGRINLNGLPHTEETYIDLIVDEMKTTSADIGSIPLPPFDSVQLVSVPEEIKRLGTIRFNGKFTGFYNDFVAYGNISTDLGYAATDLNLKIDKIPVYSGKLMLDNFQLGRFVHSGELGILSMNARINGTHFDLNQLNATVQGNISRLDFRNYPYSQIEISAHLSRKLFKGSLNVNDEHIDFDFSGSIDFTGKIPVMDFSADLNHANLTALHLWKGDSAARLAFHSDIDVTGKNIDNLQGRMLIKDIAFSEGMRKADMHHITLKSEQINGSRQITLNSEGADALLTGNFEFASLIPAFQNMLQLHFPLSFMKTTATLKPQDISYSVTFKKIQPVLDVFIPGWSIAEGTRLNGRFVSPSDEFTVSLHSPGVAWNKIQLRNTDFRGFTENDRFVFQFESPDASLRDSLIFKNFSLGGTSSFQQAEIRLKTHGRDSVTDNVELNARLKFGHEGKTMLQIEQAALTVDAIKWQIDPGNQLLFDSTGAVIDQLKLRSDHRQLAIDGYAGSKPDGTLRLLFGEFPIQPLNKVLSTFGIRAGGVINGELNIKEITAHPVIQSQLLVRDFSLYGDTLGNARMVVDFPVGKKKLMAEIEVLREGINNLSIKGSYDISADQFDFAAQLNKFNAAPFGHYLNSFASQVRGYASGEVTLTGSSKKPMLRGTVKLQKAAMTIDYLNCRYSFSNEVTITPSAFLFQNITLVDSLNNTAMLNGNISHNYFSNFKLYLSVHTKNFMVLNTTAVHNSLFYGSGFASGQMLISGPFEMISFTGNLRSEKGTEISIPLSNPEEVTQSSFVSFFSSDTARKTLSASKVDLSGISLRLDLNITEDALVKLIYDEKIGDVMEGRGNGNIVFEIAADETFTMRGDYTAASGNYVFTLQNVINKRFYIQPGGTIRWNGAPYEATIDIDAVYRTRTSLYDLLQDSSVAARRRIPVLINLSLRNRLLNPDISFNIEIPDIDPATQGLVQQAISTEESKSKQTLSLLVMNRFLPGDNRSTSFEASSSGFSANASELLSVQLTNWVSQLTDKVDVGINYRAGDKLNNDQLEVMLATRLFNDRVAIETNVGFMGSNQGASKSNSNLVGDFNVDVKITEDGKFHFKAFNRSNNINFLTNFNSLYTQGIGLYYKQEFNTLKEIFGKRKDE